MLIRYADEPSTRSGTSTVTTSGTYWAWCELNVAECTMSTECIAGTIFWLGGSQAWYDRSLRPAEWTVC
jgi:hypothetical protein